MKTLEEEKNALLDYIEESVNHTQVTIGADKSTNEERKEPHRMTLHDLQIQIQQLKGEKDELNRLNEELI